MARDPLGLQGSGFETFGRIADPESYRGIATKISNFFGQDIKGRPLPKKAPKPQAMNRKQVAQSASSMGWHLNPDGTFSKAGSKKGVKKTVKDKKPKPAMKPEKMKKTKAMKPGYPAPKKKKGKK